MSRVNSPLFLWMDLRVEANNQALREDQSCGHTVACVLDASTPHITECGRILGLVTR